MKPKDFKNEYCLNCQKSLYCGDLKSLMRISYLDIDINNCMRYKP